MIAASPVAASNKITAKDVALSNSLKRWAILSADSSEGRSDIKITDIQSGREWNVNSIPFFVFDIALSANGKYLVFVPSRGKAQLWDIEQQRTIAILEPSKHSRMKATVAAFSPDGKTLAIGGSHGFEKTEQGRITVWTELPETDIQWTQEDFDAHRVDLPVGRELRSVVCLAITDRAEHYASCDGAVWGSTLRGGIERVERIVYVPNGHLTRAISFDKTGQFLSTINLIEKDPNPESSTLSTDDIAGWSYSIWDSSGYKSIATISYSNLVRALKFNSTSATLSIIGDPDEGNALIRHWNTRDWNERPEKQFGTATEGSVKGTATGRFVSTVRKTGQQITVDVWDTIARTSVSLSPQGDCYSEDNVLLSTDGNTLVLACWVENVKASAVVFRRKDGKFDEARRVELDGHDEFSSLSANGSLLILKQEEVGARIVDLSTGKDWDSQMVSGGPVEVEKTLFSPNSKFAAVSYVVFDSEENKAEMPTEVVEIAYRLDIKRLSDRKTIQPLTGAFLDFKFSPDTRYLAACDFHGKVTIVDLITNKVSKIRLSLYDEVSFVQFDDHSRLLAAVTSGGVHIIDVPKRREIAEIPNEGVAVLDAIAFSADGKYIAIAENERRGGSGNVRVWVVDSDKLSNEALTRLEDLKKMTAIKNSQ
jgi:WD40 repeat protein